jgi:hypothetical protein
MKGGIALRINFRYHKGYRNPILERAVNDATRTFIFLPTVGERLEFDMSTIFLGLAYTRGLFVKSLEQLIDDAEDGKVLGTNPEVRRQAVSWFPKALFIAADEIGIRCFKPSGHTRT